MLGVEAFNSLGDPLDRSRHSVRTMVEVECAEP